VDGKENTMKGEGSHVNSDDFTPSLERARERSSGAEGKRREREERERESKATMSSVTNHE